MKALKRNWKLLLAVVLILAAILIVVLVYLPARDQFNRDKDSVENNIRMWQMSAESARTKIAENQERIEQNRPFETIQDELEEAYTELDLSRSELYQKFPAILREEDQILYVLYLEQLFGTEIVFSFNPEEQRVRLSDGAILGDVPLTVNYETSYQGFKDMVTYLSTDSRITSIKNSVLAYDKANDRLLGNLTLLCYVLQPDAYDPSEYVEPDITPPEETGKPVIFH